MGSSKSDKTVRILSPMNDENFDRLTSMKSTRSFEMQPNKEDADPQKIVKKESKYSRSRNTTSTTLECLNPVQLQNPLSTDTLSAAINDPNLLDKRTFLRGIHGTHFADPVWKRKKSRWGKEGPSASYCHPWQKLPPTVWISRAPTPVYRPQERVI